MSNEPILDVEEIIQESYDGDGRINSSKKKLKPTPEPSVSKGSPDYSKINVDQVMPSPRNLDQILGYPEASQIKPRGDTIADGSEIEELNRLAGGTGKDEEEGITDLLSMPNIPNEDAKELTDEETEVH